MLIDWFTVGAQALNFVILVWLMRRFLYKPVLAAIDAREKGIAKKLADADAKQADAGKERDEFKRKNDEFDEQRAMLFSKAGDEAKIEGRRLVDDARKAADALTSKRREALVNDAHTLSQAVVRTARDEVFAIARKALADLATADLEARMVDVFIRRLRGLDGQAKSDLADAVKTAPGAAVVRSAFDLPAGQKATLQNAINETFAADIRLRFEVDPGLAGGIELSAKGRKIAWGIGDYLASLEQDLAALLADASHPEAAKAGAKGA